MAERQPKGLGSMAPQDRLGRTSPFPPGGAPMKSFFQRFGSLILGVLHGFDRLRFRGSKRLLCNPGGVASYLSQVNVLLKDYKSYAKATTVELCKTIETQA